MERLSAVFYKQTIACQATVDHQLGLLPEI
jgi:hypothetical protein